MPNFFSGATPGLSRLAQALAGGDGAYQQGYDQQLGLQSRMAQALAQARAADANAEESLAKAGVERQKGSMLEGRPALVEELVAGNAGTDVPMVRAIRQTLQGNRPQVPMGPPTESGDMGIGSQQFDPALQSRVVQQLQRMAPVLFGAGDVKVDDWAKALGAYRGMDLGDQVLGGQRTAADVGRAQAAVEAKPLYNSDASGAVLDLFGGALDTSNPLALSSIGLKKEQAGAQKANAVQSYAAANASNASAAKTKAEMEQGLKTGDLVVQTNADGTVTIVNKRTATATPVMTADGKPMTGAAKELTDAQAKANLFGTRMMESDRILRELEGKYSPAAVNAKKGAENLIGIGGIAGTVGNAMLSESGQKAEQAQRDFINAVLRRESGAVISDSEFANAARQYFPQPGDSKGVLEQKARNRKLAIDGLMAEVPASRRPPAAAAPSAGGAPKNIVVDW